MTPEALKELFKPYGEVVVKRMFGGAGIYAQGLCFAIAQDGDVFLKADAVSQPDFVAAGSSPFIYVAKGRPMPTSFWRLPAIARTEANELMSPRPAKPSASIAQVDGSGTPGVTLTASRPMSSAWSVTEKFSVADEAVATNW